MDISTLQTYIVPAALMGFILIRFGRFYLVRRYIPALIAQGGVVVDVRSPAEFATGSGKNSTNLPLDTLDKTADKLDRENDVTLCCASGTRSGMAAFILMRKGFREVINAGPWRNTIL